jgi:hypothetical protein
MVENTPVQLLYSGSDVDDGTVPVDYRVDALVGFSSAYGKAARRRQSNDMAHRLRVVGLQRGSAKILVDVVEWVTKNPAASEVLVTAATALAGGAYIVLKDIAAVIRGKKHLAMAAAERRHPELMASVSSGNIHQCDHAVFYPGTGTFDFIREGAWWGTGELSNQCKGRPPTATNISDVTGTSEH